MHVGLEDRLDTVIPCLLVLTFCLAGLLTLNHYGLTFDETWHLLAGERYLSFWTTLDRSLVVAALQLRRVLTEGYHQYAVVHNNESFHFC